MKNLFANVIATVGVVGAYVIVVAILGFYLAAFIEGADQWFGWSGLWVSFVGMLMLTFLGPIGAVIVGVIGGYGAYYGWEWPLLVCIIVFFPGITLMLGSLALSAMSLVFGLFRR